jgi:sugar phosphate isomerase/epimerase
MDVTKPVAVGLIGAGRIGSFHAESIAWRVPKARLRGVADPRHGPRIMHVHLKTVRLGALDELRTLDQSFNEGVRRGVFTVPGDGELDLRPIAEFVRGSGYQGWLVVEAEQPPGPVPPAVRVAAARRHLEQLFTIGR